MNTAQILNNCLIDADLVLARSLHCTDSNFNYGDWLITHAWLRRAVYATAHATLATKRTLLLLGPDSVRLDRASFAWRT
jgi:hypothetical protein